MFPLIGVNLLRVMENHSYDYMGENFGCVNLSLPDLNIVTCYNTVYLENLTVT